jgi:hypothetical protein
MTLSDLAEHPARLRPELSGRLLAEIDELIARAELHRAEQLALVGSVPLAGDEAPGSAMKTVLAVIEDHLALLYLAQSYLRSGTLPSPSDGAGRG